MSDVDESVAGFWNAVDRYQAGHQDTRRGRFAAWLVGLTPKARRNRKALPIWKQRPADDNGDMTLLHNECHTCGRKWVSACAWWAAEHNATRRGPCLSGAKSSTRITDRLDLSKACLSCNITTTIGERLPRDEAFRRMEETYNSDTSG